jgi:DNA-directed RNA polymerase subunit RPC12/RpoP
MDMTRTQEELGPRRLPTVHLGGEDYFVDVRLGEFRTKTPPIRYIEVISFASRKGQRMLKECTIRECERCGQVNAVVGRLADSGIRCFRCGEHVFVTPAIRFPWPRV